MRVTLDFGANVTLTGGLCLQTRESWMEFLHKEKQEIRFGGCNGEIYLETEDLDAFLEKLPALCVELVHPPYMHRWGQRVVRLYDPDRHILEVGESMKTVVRRFLEEGMRPEEIAVRMDVPESYVHRMLK